MHLANFYDGHKYINIKMAQRCMRCMSFLCCFMGMWLSFPTSSRCWPQLLPGGKGFGMGKGNENGPNKMTAMLRPRQSNCCLSQPSSLLLRPFQIEDCHPTCVWTAIEHSAVRRWNHSRSLTHAYRIFAIKELQTGFKIEEGINNERALKKWEKCK